MTQNNGRDDYDRQFVIGWSEFNFGWGIDDLHLSFRV